MQHRKSVVKEEYTLWIQHHHLHRLLLHFIFSPSSYPQKYCARALILKHVHNLSTFYGNKSMLAHASTLHDNNNDKTLITQSQQIRKHSIMHKSGTQL